MGAETLPSTGTTPSVPPARSAPAETRTPPGAAVLLTPIKMSPVIAATLARPRISRPEPRLRQLMGVCGWAAVLGGVGLIIGIRGLFGVLSNDAPAWYEPSIVAVGLAGIGLTVGAFLTVHRRHEPWVLLGLSSVSLITGMFLTSSAL